MAEIESLETQGFTRVDEPTRARIPAAGDRRSVGRAVQPPESPDPAGCLLRLVAMAAEAKDESAVVDAVLDAASQMPGTRSVWAEIRLASGDTAILVRDVAGQGVGPAEGDERGARGALHGASVDATARSAPSSSYADAPIVCGGRAVGCLHALFGPGDPALGEDRRGMLEMLGGLCGLLVSWVERSDQQASDARLTERRRIAHALHDGLAQQLFAIGSSARWCLANADLDENAVRHLRRIRRSSSLCSAEVRNAIYGLRGAVSPEGEGLRLLLEEQVRSLRSESGIAATLLVPDRFPDVGLATGETVVRVVQEALANVRKHARASAVFVSVIDDADRSELRVLVEDDGIGLGASRAVGAGDTGQLHYGIEMMRALVRRMGGSLRVGDGEGGGTVVCARLPATESESR